MTEFGDLYRLQLISLDGNILEDLPLSRLPGTLPVYNGTAFATPDQPFNIKVSQSWQHKYCRAMNCAVDSLPFTTVFFIYMYNFSFGSQLVCWHPSFRCLERTKMDTSLKGFPRRQCHLSCHVSLPVLLLLLVF